MAAKKKRQKFWDIHPIQSRGCRYNVVFGERSLGKTFGVLYEAFKDFIESGEKHTLGIIRRWEEDYKGQNSMKTCYDSLMCDGNGFNQIKLLSNGKYDGVMYYNGRYYAAVLDEETYTLHRTDTVVAYAFALTAAEHYKSASFPTIRTILFDEFLTRKMYIPDEFMQFQSIVSTIVRSRDDVTIYLCGNSVSQYSPYFTEMGLSHIRKMEPGTIDVYTYGDSRLKVAVEFTGGKTDGKPSDFYFAFDNPRLKMITEGRFELEISPHLKDKFEKKDIVFTYFIRHEDQLLQCEVVQMPYGAVTFIHRKTTPIQNEDKDLIYQLDADPRPNIRQSLVKPIDRLDQRVIDFFRRGKVFYQDNEVGELVSHFLKNCA